jgi:hypothetical protein
MSRKSDFEHSTITCSECGWVGLGSEAYLEMFEEVFDYTCPQCDRVLGVFSAFDAGDP